MPLYVCHRASPDKVYRFPDDVADGGTPSGADVTLWNLPTNITNPDAIVVHEGEILVTDTSGDEVAFFAESTTGGTTPTLTRLVDFTSALTAPAGIAINSEGMWVGDDDGDDDVFLLPTSNASETTNPDGTVFVDLASTDIIKRFDLHSDIGNLEGLTIVGTNLAVADDINNRVWYVPLSTANDATSTIVREILLPPAIGTPLGIAAGVGGNLFVVDQGDDKIYLIPSTKANETTGADGRIIVTLLDSDIIRQFNLPSGLTQPYGLAFKSDAASQATLTLSTTDTNIRAGEDVDFTVASDIDITDFLLTDIAITNGTANTLSSSGVNTWTLNVTAGSAGTMTIAIGEDAVDPGNVAFSQNFTVSARVVPTITFDDAQGESGGSTGVNIAFSEPVTGLQLSDLTASSGTLSNLTGSGASWEADLAFPATGSGTVDITLAIDSTTPQNAAASASIDYQEPLQLAWIVPTVPTDNTFQVTLTSNHELTGVVIGDFRLRIADNSEPVIILDATNATLTAVAGTNNWEIDISLTGTFDGDYTVRVRRNSLMFDGMNVPTPALASDAITIDSSLGVDAVLDITLDATSVETSEIVNATFTYDKAVGDFVAADVTVTAGATKGALTDNGDNTYSMPITAPSTGTGTIAVSVAADVVTPGNNADSASFTYAPPAVPLGFGSETIDDQAWIVGTAITSLTLPEATGGTGTITYSLSPTTPAGVTFVAGTRVLSGNPTGRFTSATFTYTATDGNSDTVELTFTIVVTATAITFASNVANQSWQVGTAVNLTLPTASGGVGTFTYSLTPALPAGVTRSNRVLSGTPTTAVTVATYTYTATDSESVTHTQTFTIIVADASAIVFSGTIAAQAWTVGTAESLTLPTATGGVGTITYSLSPTLPTGTTFVASTRVLSGTPTGRFASTTFTYTATDSAGTTNVLTFTIVVTAVAITIPNIANQMWTVGTAVSVTLPAGSGGVGTLTASLTGTLPAGVTFTASTRALAGNPTAVFSVATFTYTLTDAEGESASITFTIVVAAAGMDTPSNLTGAGVLIANSAGLGQGENRPRGLDSDGTHLYAIGVTQRRLIRITDLDTFASEYASAQLSGNLNSLAFNDDSFYYADNNNVIYRIDSPFDTSSTSTSLGNITNSGQIRSLCSDRTDVFGYDRTNSILYRIVDNGTDITATTFATVDFPTGTTGNILSMFYFGNAFYLGNTDDNNLWKLPDNLTAGTLDVVPVRVGDFTDFDVSEGSPAGAGVLGSEAYFLGDDTNSLFRFLKTTPTNTAPAFADAFYTFTDVAIAVGETVGTVVATDADNDTLSYSLEGTDAADFNIDVNGQITVAVELTNSQVYGFNVVADDGTDTTNVGVFATAVAANNAPAFADASYAFADVAIAVGTVVGTVAATDADNDTLSYTLTGASFAIDANGQITVTVALTNSQIYSFNVVADDGTDTTSVGVSVTAAAVEPLSLAWIVPTVPTNNTFSATLTSNRELTDVAIDDFRLRVADNSEPIVALTAANTTLTAVAGTNNWRLGHFADRHL